MSDEGNKEHKPARALTLRIGDEIFTDVVDYLVLIRDKEGGLTTKLSDHHWGYEAVLSTLATMDQINLQMASHDCDEDGCGEPSDE